MPPNDPQPGETWRQRSGADLVRITSRDIEPGYVDFLGLRRGGDHYMDLADFRCEYEYVAAPEEAD